MKIVKIGLALKKERCVWPQDMQAFQVISISIIHFFAISRSVQRLAQKEKSLSYQLQPIKVDVVVRCPLKADWDAFEALGHNSSFVIADYDNVL